MHSRFYHAWVAKFLDPVLKLSTLIYLFWVSIGRQNRFPFSLKNLFNKVLSKISVARELAILIGMRRGINFISSQRHADPSISRLQSGAEP